MRVALLVHPSWPDPARARAYAERLAEKHPDADVLSAGVGLPVYQAERGALAAGLRVAAFRAETPEPGRGPWERADPDDPTPFPPVRVDVVVYELLPGDPDHLARLWHPGGRVVGGARGLDAAWSLARRTAAAASDEVVVLSHVEGWPDGVEGHRVAL